MRTTLLSVIVLCLLFLKTNSQNNILIGNTTVEVDTVFTGLDVPWEIVYGPDQHLWITERKGIVSRIDPLLKTRLVILDLTGTVAQHAESGLLGIALHPDFPAVNEVFLVYTYGTLPNLQERLVKYFYANNSLQNPQILIDGIKGNTGHNGSRLEFLPDKSFLMSTGEAHNGPLAQDLNSLNGKILRLKTDGSIPADNPFAGSYVYSYGHRNAQGLVLAPNGLVYSSEHGPQNDDEFQILEKGRNYGWPLVEGFCDLPAELTACTTYNVREPIRSWTPTLAVGDLCWYTNSSFPELHERILMCNLRSKKLLALKLGANGTQVDGEDSYLENMFGRLRAVAVGPNAEIYLATNGADAANIDPGTHSIIVLRPPLPPTGLKTEEMQSLHIFPSPGTGKFKIQYPENTNGSLTISDAMGKVMLEMRAEGKTSELDLSYLPKGIYLFKLITQQQDLLLRKLVIE